MDCASLAAVPFSAMTRTFAWMSTAVAGPLAFLATYGLLSALAS
jgi:hypothetical protein